MSFSWACLILARHSSSSITSPTYSITNAPWKEQQTNRLFRFTRSARWPKADHFEQLICQGFPFCVAVPMPTKAMSLRLRPCPVIDLFLYCVHLFCVISLISLSIYIRLLWRLVGRYRVSSVFPGFDPAYVFIFVLWIILFYCFLAGFWPLLWALMMILGLPVIKHTKRLCTCILPLIAKPYVRI